MSVRLRATLITALFLGCASLALSGLALSSLRANLTQESQRKIEVTLSLLQQIAAGPLREGDTFALAGIADRAAKGQPARVCITDRYGQILADSAHKSYDKTNHVIRSAMDSRRRVIERSDGIWEAAAAVDDDSGRLTGAVYVTFSAKPFDDALRHTTRSVMAFAMIAVIIGAGIALLFGRRLGSSFSPLMSAIRKTTAGEFSIKMPATGVAELDEIGRAFGRMSSIVERRINGLERMNQMASELSTARTIDDFAKSVTTACDSILLGQCNLLLTEPGGGAMRTLGGDSSRRRITPACATAIAARERRAVTIGMKADMAPGSEILEGLRPDSAAIAPLVTPDGDTAGAILCVYDWRKFSSPERDDAANLATIANLAAPALYAIRRGEGRDPELDALLQILIPHSLPEPPGLEVYAGCFAAQDAAGFAADYYDVLPLPGEAWAFAIGGVSGRGAEAARQAAAAKHVVRSFIFDGSEPGKALARAEAALAQEMDAGRTFTTFLGTYEPRSHRLTYSSAGHPFPIRFCAAEGRIRDLSTNGRRNGEEAFREDSIDLEPGDILALYTRGVTETRIADEQYGLERLKSVVRGHASKDLKSLAEVIVRDVCDFSGGRLRDDLALMLARVKN